MHSVLDPETTMNDGVVENRAAAGVFSALKFVNQVGNYGEIKPVTGDAAGDSVWG